MNLLVAQIALGVYAVLLAVGGLIGFLKAGSRPSLVAGLLSAAVALASVYWTVREAGTPYGYQNGLMLGRFLALFLCVLFGMRYSRTRKFMPSGMLAIVSAAMVLLLWIVIAANKIYPAP